MFRPIRVSSRHRLRCIIILNIYRVMRFIKSVLPKLWIIVIFCLPMMAAAQRPRGAGEGGVAPANGADPAKGIALAKGAATLYVDALGSDDGHSGLSPAAAWRTLEKVDAHVFQPGERLLFRAGRRYEGQLVV